MKEKLKKHKKILIIVVTIITILTIYSIKQYQHKQEFKKQAEVQKPQEENLYVDFTKEEDKGQLQFLPYRIIEDKENKKVIIVFVKNKTDFESNYAYYIKQNEKKEKLDIFYNDEEKLILEANIQLQEKFKIVLQDIDDSKKIKEIEVNSYSTKKYNLKNITKEEFKNHERLEHNIISVKGQIKIATEELKKQEDLLEWSNRRIKELLKDNDKKGADILTRGKEEIEENIKTQQKIKEEKEKELKELEEKNEVLEKIFTDLFGELHSH